ncbi:hypothetical protein TSOC_000554 [Tetrabaena socialis]|uniref:BZIP domain-containing protein n=1 Tax=Tetrabaena socialis TaxID=47790 RepID=A0A2J8AIX4_9CHLO|nr:hypothetical protein TSOC_000554 [Tetrabaena socialis]|eukprot:PNH12476.1 hypothetical protein TSOC_000554 [Tetrabaena socialis]
MLDSSWWLTSKWLGCVAAQQLILSMCRTSNLTSSGAGVLPSTCSPSSISVTSTNGTKQPRRASRACACACAGAAASAAGEAPALSARAAARAASLARTAISLPYSASVTSRGRSKFCSRRCREALRGGAWLAQQGQQRGNLLPLFGGLGVLRSAQLAQSSCKQHAARAASTRKQLLEAQDELLRYKRAVAAQRDRNRRLRADNEDMAARLAGLERLQLGEELRYSASYRAIVHAQVPVLY